MKNLARLLLVRLRLVPFDREFYLNTNDDVARVNADPLTHYLRFGWKEGRIPNPDLDFDHYSTAFSQIREREGFSFVSFLLGNRGDSSKVNADAYKSIISKAPVPDSPSASQWENLIAEREQEEADTDLSVDVIIPVYGARPITLNCVYHVLKSRNECCYELTVIDDASPDLELRDELDTLAAQGLFTLVRHERNVGFVQSANAGLALHSHRDVVLLNSDTEVYGNWLDRLRRHAYSDPRVATVTPFQTMGPSVAIRGFAQITMNNSRSSIQLSMPCCSVCAHNS